MAVGLLFATMEPPANIEEEFQDWYDTEHFPERQSLPGIPHRQPLRVRRRLAAVSRDVRPRGRRSAARRGLSQDRARAVLRVDAPHHAQSDGASIAPRACRCIRATGCTARRARPRARRAAALSRPCATKPRSSPGCASAFESRAQTRSFACSRLRRRTAAITLRWPSLRAPVERRRSRRARRRRQARRHDEHLHRLRRGRPPGAFPEDIVGCAVPMTIEASSRKPPGSLIAARRTRQPLDRLPEDCRPATLDDAFAIEEATVVADWASAIAGWKVAQPARRTVLLRHRPRLRRQAQRRRGRRSRRAAARHGGRDRVPLPAGCAAARRALFVRRGRRRASSRFPLIEIVASRYRRLRGHADHRAHRRLMSNGAFVVGDDQPRWRAIRSRRTFPYRSRSTSRSSSSATAAIALGRSAAARGRHGQRLRAEHRRARRPDDHDRRVHGNEHREAPGQRVAVPRSSGFAVCEVGLVA